MIKPKLRSVNTHFWDDAYIVELDPTEKLIFLYLMTNPQTNLVGAYEIAIKRIAFDTGYDKDMVLKILERLTADKKVYYKNGYIVMVNFAKNQNLNANMRKSAYGLIDDLPASIKDLIVEKEINGLISLYKPLANRYLTVNQPLANGYQISRKEEREVEDEVEEEVEERVVVDEVSAKADSSPPGDLTSRPAKKYKYTGSEDDLKYKEFIDKRVIPLFPIEPTDSAYIKWLRDARLLLTKDGFDKDGLINMIMWLRKDSFWESNFMSFLKLRKLDKEGIRWCLRFRAEWAKKSSGDGGYFGKVDAARKNKSES